MNERDELVEFLKSVELAILAGSSTYPDRPASVGETDVEVDVVGDDDGEAERERSAKRKAIAGECLFFSADQPRFLMQYSDPIMDNRPVARKRASDIDIRSKHVVTG